MNPFSMLQCHAQLEALFRRRQAGVKFSLDGIRRLCAGLGNPEKDLRFIHIAGTNGKGSVAAMCAAILQESGLRTGLYTSPHLSRYHERFRMDGADISDEDLNPLLEKVMLIAEDTTFFEVSTALALCWFRQRRAQIVVWETGLGGRLDATNIVTPVVSVITPIGLEHAQFLGNSVAEIASEKAGIIKPCVPFVTLQQDPEIMKALIDQAAAQKAPIKVIAESALDEFAPPLIGNHQRGNTALAVAAAREALRVPGSEFRVPSLTRETIREGLAKTRWPGRCQLIERGKGLPAILVDGAHNPMGAQALANEVRRCWGNGSLTLIFGALADKNIAEMGRILGPLATEVLLTRVSSERSASSDELKRAFPSGRWMDSLASALAEADRADRPVVIAGSLFLAGEALELLKGRARSAHPNECFKKVF